MTVSTLSSIAEFSTNGVTTNFPFFFKFLSNEDLVVTYIDPLGGRTILVLGSQYTVNGAGEEGGSIVTSVALAGPGQLIVSREMDAYQQTSLRNQGKFLAETHEDVFDRLTMLVQQGFSIFSRALMRPFGRDYFNAENRNISNLKDPVADQDAATKHWSSVFFAGLIGAIQGPINNALNILFVQRGTGSVARVVSDKLKEELSLGDFGGGPAATNTTALNSALTAARSSKDKQIRISPGQNDTGIVSNPTGIRLFGGDLVEKPDASNSSTWDMLSSNADFLSYQLGNEYLYALHNEISIRATVKIMMVGDSTVVGVGSTAPFTPAGVISDRGLDLGLVGVVVNNLAVSGTASPQWDTAPIIADTSTHCLIVGYGTNDPAAGDEVAFFNNMSAKLAAVRAARNVQSLTIILKGANSTNDWVNGRSQLWCERIAPVYRKLARLYQCYFFDTYNFLRDSKNSAHLWMDTLQYSGIDTHIHPNNFGNMWIWGELARNIFTNAIGQRKVNNYRNVGAGHTLLSAAATPADMQMGRAIYRTEATGWPSVGAVFTEQQADGVVVVQECVAQNRSITKVHRRNSISSAPGLWTDWTGIGRNITLQNGWTNHDLTGTVSMPAQCIVEESGHISARGRIKPGTLTVGTIILNVTTAIPNSNPLLGEYFELSCDTGRIRAGLGTAGNLTIVQVSGTPTDVSLSGVRWMPS